MAVILNLKSGSWRAQVRRKGRYASGTFIRKKDAEDWAPETERSIDQGLEISVQPKKHCRTFRDLVDLHIKDMHDVGRPIRVKRKLKSTVVIDALTDLFILRGVPVYIRSDNGPAFVAKAVHTWMKRADHSDNGQIERNSGSTCVTFG